MSNLAAEICLPHHRIVEQLRATALEGDTATLTFRAVGDSLTVFVNDEVKIDLVDSDPLLGPGRIGFGQHSNPCYFDDVTITRLEGEEISFDVSADGASTYTLAAPDASDAVSISATPRS